MLDQPFAPLDATPLPRTVNDGTEPRQYAFISAPPGIAALESTRVTAGVGIAKQDVVVTGCTRFQSDIGEAGVERGTIHHRAVVLHVHPGI